MSHVPKNRLESEKLKLDQCSFMLISFFHQIIIIINNKLINNLIKINNLLKSF